MHRFDFDEEAIKVDSNETVEIAAESGRNIYTIGAGPCTVYGIGINKNSARSALGHHTSVPDKITNALPELEKDRKKGFIIGGCKFPPDAFFQEARAKYKKNDVQTTIFWGQKTGYYSDVCYVPKKDTVYISTTNNYDDRCIDSLERLKQAFQIIEIAKGDKVYIGDKKINSLDIVT